MRRVRMVLGATLLKAQALQAPETIGPRFIGQGSQSAKAGIGAGIADRGNVVTTPVTVDDALSGLCIIDDGRFNPATGRFYQVMFVPPAINGPGGDFVVFDAQYDPGEYSLQTSYVGLVTSVATSGWGDSGGGSQLLLRGFPLRGSRSGCGSTHIG